MQLSREDMHPFDFVVTKIIFTTLTPTYVMLNKNYVRYVCMTIYFYFLLSDFYFHISFWFVVVVVLSNSLIHLFIPLIFSLIYLINSNNNLSFPVTGPLER